MKKSIVRKSIAFILDVIILCILALSIELIIFSMVHLFCVVFGITKENASENFMDCLKILEYALDISMILIYFLWIPKKIGNTFGRKILKVEEKYKSSQLIEKAPEFPDEKLKREEILNVSIKDGCWLCPSCNASNNKLYDICKQCGQAVNKI